MLDEADDTEEVKDNSVTGHAEHQHRNDQYDPIYRPLQWMLAMYCQHSEFLGSVMEFVQRPQRR